MADSLDTDEVRALLARAGRGEIPDAARNSLGVHLARCDAETLIATKEVLDAFFGSHAPDGAPTIREADLDGPAARISEALPSGKGPWLRRSREHLVGNGSFSTMLLSLATDDAYYRRDHPVLMQGIADFVCDLARKIALEHTPGTASVEPETAPVDDDTPDPEPEATAPARRPRPPLSEILSAGAGDAAPRPDPVDVGARPAPPPDPEARPDPARQAPAATVPPPAPADRPGETRMATPAGADPDDPEIIMFEDGSLYTETLFAPDETIEAAGLMRLPAALTPPPDPEAKSAEHMAAWLSGTIWSRGAPVVRAHVLDAPDEGDMMELESEVYSAPAAAIESFGARRPQAEALEDIDWCIRLGRDIGAFGCTNDRAVKIFAAHLSAFMETSDGRDALRPLMRDGADLVVHESLAEALAATISVEAEFMSDSPGGRGRRPQDIRGSASPEGDLETPFCLNRTCFLYIEAGVPLGSALRQSLTELRYAQVLKADGAATDGGFDARFAADPGAYMEELRATPARAAEPQPAF